MKIRFTLMFAAALAAGAPALAQSRTGGFPIIRDAEIENIIRAYSTPIFKASGLAAGDVRVHLIDDNRLNAFVAGGQNIFLNTGLLMRAEGAGQVIGVIAHETGHIVGGHLIRLQHELEAARIKQIISMIAAVGASIAARDGRVAAAGAGLGARLTEGTFYRFTQTMENAADAHALATLDRLRYSAKGLFDFMRILEQQEMIYPKHDPYLRTHPLTRERVDAIRQHLARSPYTNVPMPPQFDAMQLRLRAKLIGFLRPPAQVMQTYAGREKELEARYALAVAYHRDAQLDRSLGYIDGLVKEHPRDAYFQELRGQILFESGRVREAIGALTQAVKLAPREGLIRVGLAQAQLEAGDPALLQAALANLRESVRRDDTYPLTWRLLSVAHGKLGDEGNAALANAEYWYLLQDLGNLRAALARAERALKRGSPAWVRMQDLKAQVSHVMDQRRR